MKTFFTTRSGNGVWRTVHKLIYKLAQRVMTLNVTHLMLLDRKHLRPPTNDLDEITFRFLTSDEVRSFATAENDLTPELGDRLDFANNFCFAALSGDRLAGYAWYSLESIEAEHNRGGDPNSGVALSFPEDMAFMYKGFTHPNFRGQGLYGYVNARALEALEACGVSRVISTADWTNWSALRICWRVGYQDLGRIWRGGRGSMMLTIAPRRGQALGIKFGRNALVPSRPNQLATKASHLQ